MRSVALLVPGSLRERTGGYIYDARVADGLRQRGWQVEVREIAAPAFPGAAASLATGAIALVDGLLYSHAPDVAVAHGARLQFVPIIHLPLAEDVGLSAAESRRLEALERRALAAATRVVATGPGTVASLQAYGVARPAIVLAVPGTDQAPRAHGTGDPLQLLCVGTVNPGKGHLALIRALAKAPHRRWHLTCAGSLTRDPETVSQVRSLIEAEGLGRHVTLAGELDSATLQPLYAAADLFVLPTLKETFGMAVAEAIACGLPVLSTRTGAVPEIVGASAGIFIEPGDEEALARSLDELLTNDRRRAELGDAAWASRHLLPTWDRTLDKIGAALDELSTTG